MYATCLWSQVGLAVDDTKAIQDQAQLKRLSLQVCQYACVRVFCVCLYVCVCVCMCMCVCVCCMCVCVHACVFVHVCI